MPMATQYIQSAIVRKNEDDDLMNQKEDAEGGMLNSLSFLRETQNIKGNPAL